MLCSQKRGTTADDKGFCASGTKGMTNCIKFKTLKDVEIDILEEAMRYGVEQTDNLMPTVFIKK